ARAGDMLSPAASSVLRSIAGGGPDTTLANVGKNVAIGAAAGTGQFAGEHLAPEGYKPLGGLAGSLLGAGAGIGGAEGLRFAGSRIRPDAEGGAAQQFRAAATNPDAARSALEGAPEQQPVPGFQPTTAEATADPGLLSLQNWARNQQPEAFRERANANNAAIVQGLQGLAPGGDPAAVGSYFTSALSRLDDAYAAKITAAQQQLDQRLGQMGGEPVLGGDADTLRQQYGQQLRAIVQEGKAERDAQESRLWDAARQNGDLSFDQQPAVTGAQRALADRRFFNPQGGDKLEP